MSLKPRRSRMLVAALAGALAASLAISVGAPAATAAPLAPGTKIQPQMFGMHVKDLEFGSWPTVPVGAIRLWDNRTSWTNIETSQGNFDWTNLDTSVATARAKGVNDIMMVLAGTPAWASDDPSPAALPVPGAAGMPKDFAWWDNWVRQVVTRYKGKITSYQPWNEANLSTFSTGSPAEMADLTKRAYDIIKSIDPNAIVIAPSTGTRLGGPFKKFYPAFLQELGKRGWPVDVWAAHTYPASLGTPRERGGLAVLWQQALRAAGAPAKPLWDTENNFGLKGPGPENPDVDLDGVQAAQWVGKTYVDAVRLGISRVYWYRWETSGFNDLWGIQMYDGTPGAKAFKTMQDWMVGASVKKCKTKGISAECTFTDKAGKPTRIVYTLTDKVASFKTNGATTQCDVLGVCTPVKGKKIRTAGPVLLS